MADTLERYRVDPERTALARPRTGRPLLYASVGVVLAGVLAVVLFVGVGVHRGPPEVAPGINSSASYLMNLDVFGGPPAPNFTLTDQHHREVSLSQFRGKSVVLSFNDDRCTDICTLLAQDVAVADRDLGSAAHHVVFLAVNTNPYHPDVSTVRSWTDNHGLGHERNWVFVTGPPTALSKVWNEYGVEVELDPTNRTVVHSTELYFIGPDGRQAAIGSFGTASADTLIYSHTMAQMANDVLPASERVDVAGPSVLAPDQSDAAIGARVPRFTLPLLETPTRTVTSGGLRRHYTVLNFWSSGCAACVREMPSIEQAYRDLGARVDFVGIDVSDNRAAAIGLAKRAGVTYPLASDASGTLASTYRIPGLPFTAILAPKGTLRILHPGAMTTEQLEYVVKNLDPALVRS